ncbi:MAG: YCF48-related protein [Burkholderiales bacterium]
MPALSANRPDFIDLAAGASPHAARTLQVAVAAAGSRLISVGERGVVLYSDDAGRSWTQAKVPVSVTLTGVQFVDERTGWVVGHDGVVLRSTDAGQTWVRMFDGNQANALVVKAAEQRIEAARANLPTASGTTRDSAQKAVEQAEFAADDAQSAQKFGPSRPLLGLWFSTPVDGYVVGSYGQIFHTSDGGRQWQFVGSRMNNPDGLHLNAIQGTADTLIVAAEAGKLFRSDDSGQTWRTLNTGYNGPLYGVLDLGEPHAAAILAFGFGGRIFRSHNGGASWEAVNPGDKRATLVAGRRLASGLVLLLAQDGTLWRSADDGRSVQPVGKPAAAIRVAGLTELADGAGAALAGLGGVVIMPLASKP